MLVAVGSKNPVKVQAVKAAFEKVFPEKKWDVVGIEVESEVSAQPMSDEESVRGARNRAQKALKKMKADFGVGIEGGLQKIEEYWFTRGWMVIVNQKGDEGVGSSVSIRVTDRMMELIHQGKELGEVNDIIFKKTNSKHAQGHFGLMTNNAVTRQMGYTDGVISALARFINPHLFE